jgi:predicted aspartyl protease
VSLPFDPAHGLIVAPVRLEGPQGATIARLALDTGATITLVSERLLASLGYDIDAATRQQPISMGSGVAFAPYIEISRLATLGQERRDFLVLAHTLPPTSSVDGVLGLDFLRGQRLLIDFRLGLVLLD